MAERDAEDGLGEKSNGLLLRGVKCGLRGREGRFRPAREVRRWRGSGASSVSESESWMWMRVGGNSVGWKLAGSCLMRGLGMLRV